MEVQNIGCVFVYFLAETQKKIFGYNFGAPLMPNIAKIFGLFANVTEDIGSELIELCKLYKLGKCACVK